MAKGGPLSFILPAALGIGALATGGFGLPGLLGDVGATAGEAGTAAGISEAVPAGLDAAGPGILGGAATEVATPLTAGAVETLAPAADPFAVSGPLNVSGPALGEAIGPALAAQGNVSNLLAISSDPTDLTAGVGGGVTPVTAAPLTGTGFAGQPLSAANDLATIAQTGVDPTTGGTIDAIAEGGGQPQVGLGPLTAPGVTTGTTAIDAATAPTTAGGGGFFSDIASGNIGSAFSDVGGFKGLTALASAGLLGSELLRGPQQYPEQAALGQQAGGYLGLGNTLAQPIQTGALPPGAESAVDLSTAAAKARTKQSFANLGLSGSTMETQALNTADEQAAAQKFGIADQLLQNAMQYSQLGTGTTTNLLRTSMLEDQQYREALANFAKALGGTGAALSA